MPYIVDSYPTSEANATVNLNNGNFTGLGQSFTVTTPTTLYSARLLLSKGGSPTGNFNAKIYNYTGTPGVDAVPSGSVIATSDNLDVTTLTGSQVLTELRFTGANAIFLTPGNYILTSEYTGGNVSNYVVIGEDLATPTDDGNASLKFQAFPWIYASDEDMVFYIYGSTYNQVHTIDSLKRKQYMVDHTITSSFRVEVDMGGSAAFFGGYGGGFAGENYSGVTPVIAARVTTTHTIDSLLRNRYMVTHTIDSLLRNRYIQTHTVDSFLRAAHEVAHTIDAYLGSPGAMVNHTLDSVLRARSELNHTIDSLVHIQGQLAHTIDSRMYGRYVLSHTFDALLRKQVDITHTINSSMSNRLEETHTIDGLLKVGGVPNHTIDAFLKARNTIIHTIDAALHVAYYTSHTIDARLQIKDPEKPMVNIDTDNPQLDIIDDKPTGEINIESPQIDVTPEDDQFLNIDQDNPNMK